jgi:hypothetical protein
MLSGTTVLFSSLPSDPGAEEGAVLGLALKARGLLAGDFLDFQGRFEKTTAWGDARFGGVKVRH